MQGVCVCRRELRKGWEAMDKILELQNSEEINEDAMHQSTVSYFMCIGAPSNGSAMFC